MSPASNLGTFDKLCHLVDVQDYYAAGSNFTVINLGDCVLLVTHMRPKPSLTGHQVFFLCAGWTLSLSAVSAGFRERDRWALAGERVRLPADQPEAVRPASGADGLGGTPGLLPLRPLSDRQWETELQVRRFVTVRVGSRALNCIFRPTNTQKSFHKLLFMQNWVTDGSVGLKSNRNMRRYNHFLAWPRWHAYIQYFCSVDHWAEDTHSIVDVSRPLTVSISS